jgi:hypothetical protein
LEQIHKKLREQHLGFVAEIAKLEAEADRPIAQRLPKDSIPERTVLQALKLFAPCPAAALNTHDSYAICEPLPDGKAVHAQVVRYLEYGSMAMHLGFSLRTVYEERLGNVVPIGTMPWLREMGSWTDINWGWFLCLLFHKVDLKSKLSGVTLTYKMQDRPEADFVRKVEVAFKDVCRTKRCAPLAAQLEQARFEDHCLLDRNNRLVFFDVNLHNDVCHAFDTKFYQVALDLGLPVEDRKSSPALTFQVGNKAIPIEHPNAKSCVRGRSFESPEAYVRARLNAAVSMLGPGSPLSQDEAKRHVQYMWELLSSQQVMMNLCGYSR